MDFKIASINLCLGLENRRIDVENLLIENEIMILCLQEVEIESNFDLKNLKLKGYQF